MSDSNTMERGVLDRRPFKHWNPPPQPGYKTSAITLGVLMFVYLLSAWQVRLFLWARCGYPLIVCCHRYCVFSCKFARLEWNTI